MLKTVLFSKAKSAQAGRLDVTNQPRSIRFVFHVRRSRLRLWRWILSNDGVVITHIKTRWHSTLASQRDTRRAFFNSWDSKSLALFLVLANPPSKQLRVLGVLELCPKLLLNDVFLDDLHLYKPTGWGAHTWQFLLVFKKRWFVPQSFHYLPHFFILRFPPFREPLVAQRLRWVQWIVAATTAMQSWTWLALSSAVDLVIHAWG